VLANEEEEASPRKGEKSKVRSYQETPSCETSTATAKGRVKRNSNTSRARPSLGIVETKIAATYLTEREGKYFWGKQASS